MRMAGGVAVKSIDDKNMDISMLEKFLLEQIKVGGKPGVLSDSVPLRETKERSLLTSPPIPTSPNVSGQKYLRKYNLRDWLSVTALNKDRDRYHLRYLNIVTATEIRRQAVEELLYIFGSAFVMENENLGCLVGCGEPLIASVL
ncbi:hypothetical protein HID58_066744, partial [Brassica napus]